MSKHNEIGIKGENIAADYLLNKGYILLHRNWRAGHKEVDLIVAKGNLVVFVEIKTRSATAVSFPEESVNKAKQSRLRSAAEAFMDQNLQYRDYRFDIISITMHNNHPKIVHFEYAF